MKRIFTLAVMAIAAICTIIPASAQRRGEMTLGVNGGYATHNDGGYANLYFQYTPVEHIRLAPEIGYVFRNKGKSAFNMAVDVQFPFRLAKGIAVYPLTGLVFNSWDYSWRDNNINRLGVDFGGGFDFYQIGRAHV